MEMQQRKECFCGISQTQFYRGVTKVIIISDVIWLTWWITQYINFFFGQDSFYFAEKVMKPGVTEDQITTISKAYLLVMFPILIVLILKTQQGMYWQQLNKISCRTQPTMVQNKDLFKRKYLNAFYLYSCTYYWSYAALQSIINLATNNLFKIDGIKAALWLQVIVCIPCWLVLYLHVRFSDRQHFMVNSIVMQKQKNDGRRKTQQSVDRKLLDTQDQSSQGSLYNFRSNTQQIPHQAKSQYVKGAQSSSLPSTNLLFNSQQASQSVDYVPPAPAPIDFSQATPSEYQKQRASQVNSSLKGSVASDE